VRFEWDELTGPFTGASGDKNEANQKKHGVSFETAKLVFDDPDCLLVPDRIEAGEQRRHAIGMTFNTRLILTVVHNQRTEGSEEIVRIISARRATRREENDYAESL